MNAALEPVRVIPGLFQELGHLRMMAEGIEGPTDPNVHAELTLVISLSVQSLADPRFAAGNVDVEHHVVCPDNLQASFRHEFSELRRFLRISLQERLHIGHLIENKPIVGMSPQQVEHRQNMRQPDFQILLARFEDRAFPVGMGNNPERGRGRSLGCGTRCLAQRDSRFRLPCRLARLTRLNHTPD